MTNVLLIEDNSAYIAIVSRYFSLSEEEYSVTTRHNLAEGLEVIETEGRAGVDVVLLDLSIPAGPDEDIELSPSETLDQFFSQHKTMAVIVLTHHAGRDIRQQAATVGADGYIVKKRLADFEDTFLDDEIFWAMLRKNERERHLAKMDKLANEIMTNWVQTTTLAASLDNLVNRISKNFADLHNEIYPKPRYEDLKLMGIEVETDKPD